MLNFPLQQTCWSNLGKTFNVARVPSEVKTYRSVLRACTVWPCTCTRMPNVHSKSTMVLKTCCSDYGFNERVFGGHSNLNWIHKWMGVLCLMPRVRTWIDKKNVLNLVSMMFQSRMLTKEWGEHSLSLILCHYQHNKQNWIFGRCLLDTEQLSEISVKKESPFQKSFKAYHVIFFSVQMNVQDTIIVCVMWKQRSWRLEPQCSIDAI